ncbi:MAG TPA: helix-turn-helix transcriptional regulator [Lachnospiraceae bacterium]|nr:helix-turn-helix transcriptional regulator [Lachnospiraceae bacterium]
MPFDFISLGLRIQSLRTDRGISQETLAAEVKISQTFLSQIETGQRVPSLETVVALANALHVSSDELLVDNLTSTATQNDNDLDYLLLDCTPEESTIIVKNAASLKKILKRYKIK